jgi:hypothetical protein
MPKSLDPDLKTLRALEPMNSLAPGLITVKGQYSGYYKEDLEATLDDDELGRWLEWSSGITGALHEGRFLVYKHDWEDFKAERPNLD